MWCFTWQHRRPPAAISPSAACTPRSLALCLLPFVWPVGKMPPPIKKRKFLTLQEKSAIIAEAAKGRKKSDIAEEFNIPCRLLSTILKSKDSIMESNRCAYLFIFQQQNSREDENNFFAWRFCYCGVQLYSDMWHIFFWCVPKYSQVKYNPISDMKILKFN